MALFANIYQAADGRRDALSVLPADAVEVLVMNVPGPFHGHPSAARVIIEDGPLGSKRAVPVDADGNKIAGVMFGGRYIASSDGRFQNAVGFYGAVALHDRFEG